MQDEALKKVEEENQHLKAELERLKGIILLLNRSKFGSTSERVTDLDPSQLVFNEIEKEASTLPTHDEMETISYDRKKVEARRSPFQSICLVKRKSLI